MYLFAVILRFRLLRWLSQSCAASLATSCMKLCDFWQRPELCVTNGGNVLGEID